MVLILFTALLARIHIASDPELHDWDEQYHALVGKNMFRSDFKAEMYDQQLIKYDFKEWIANGVWYSKGPVPLVLIGASVEVFGEFPFAVRLPSILLSLLSVFLTFLIGKKLFNEKVALIAMFLHAIHGSILELIGGRLSSDHVEVAFIFFVQLSFYFLLCWCQIPKKRNQNAVLIGLSVALAFLSKWFPGFLVFPVFAVLLIMNQEFNWREQFKYLGLALLSCALIVVPYVLVQMDTHPEEFSWMMKQLLFGADMQATFHASPWYFYLENIHAIFGPLAFVALFFTIYRMRSIGIQKVVFVVLWIGIPFIIFSFPQMKRGTYMLISAPAYFLVLGYLVQEMLDYAAQQKIVNYGARVVAILIVGFALVYHVDRAKYFENPPISTFDKSEWLDFEATLKEPSKTVVFNYFDCHKAMFYTELTVYRNNCPKPSHSVFLSHEVYAYQNGEFIHLAGLDQ